MFERAEEHFDHRGPALPGLHGERSEHAVDVLSVAGQALKA
jgi:hypothetical protein